MNARKEESKRDLDPDNYYNIGENEYYKKDNKDILNDLKRDIDNVLISSID